MARKSEPEEEFDDTDADFTLVDVLKNPEITKALNIAVQAWADIQPKQIQLRFWSMMLGIGFSITVLFVIGFLGYLNVLSKDVTGSLIGGLLGYWFGRYQGGKN